MVVMMVVVVMMKLIQNMKNTQNAYYGSHSRQCLSKPSPESDVEKEYL